MTQNGPTKTRQGSRKTRAIVALAAGSTYTEAAKTAGVGRRTLYRYLQNDEFKLAVERARSELIGRAVGKLSNLSSRAVDRLAELLDSEKESTRLSAIRTALTSLPALREHTDLSEKLEQLESRLCEVRVTGFGGAS